MNFKDFIPLQYFPAINASLNALCAFFLVTGLIFIKLKKRQAHQVMMISAFATSIVFLASYLHYHYHQGSTPYQGTGLIRALYFSILISHTILAGAVPVLALITLTRAIKGQFDRHARIARWTLPIWLYVSVTGVIIYGMLYF